MKPVSIYLDHAAATPMSTHVKEAMEPYFSVQFYNPSAQYLAAQKVREAVDGARASVAKIIGARPGEVIFTAGGTESDNLAVLGVMQQFPDANCVVSAVEHEAVLRAAALFPNKVVNVKPDGRIDLDELQKSIDDRTVLVSVMYVNNEIGTVQPIAEIAKIIKEIVRERVKAGNTLPLYLHTDAAQAPNYLHVLVNTLGVDLMTLNGGKIYGPKASGVLYVKTGVQLTPLIHGGGQERSLRSGTESVTNIVGLATALEDAHDLKESESKRMMGLQSLAYDLLEETIPSVHINGSRSHRVPNNIHITLPGEDNERLMMALDEKGFMVAVGSACSASSEEPSHVLRAIGLTDEEARSSLRITMGRDTSEEDVRQFVKTLSELSRTASRISVV